MHWLAWSAAILIWLAAGAEAGLLALIFLKLCVIADALTTVSTAEDD